MFTCKFTILLVITLNYAKTMSAFGQAQLRPAEESIDKLSKWKKRWDDNFIGKSVSCDDSHILCSPKICIFFFPFNNIGWHKDEPHRNLLKYGNQVIPSFDVSSDEKSCQSEEIKNSNFRIFVPLCGKTVDMAFLAKHPSVSQVVGVDGIRKALTEFAEENPSFEIKTDVINSGEEKDSGSVVERLNGNGIQLLRGDLFDLNDAVTEGKFNMILDRASIVAIQPSLREKYVDIMGKLIQPGGSILLMTVDRRAGTEEAKKSGPPFSVDENEVRRLYENLEWVEDVKLVDEHDEFQDQSMKDRMKELDSLYELCFIITAKK